MASNMCRIAGIVSVLALTVAGCGTREGTTTGAGTAATKSELVFAAVPTEQAQNLEAIYKPLIGQIQKDTGVTVKFQAVASNSGVIEAQVAKRVDIGNYGAFSYYIAKSKADISPVAAPVPAPDAKPGAFAYGVVRPDSTIKSLPDVKGKSICFTDPASTTGYLQPLASLKEAGVDPGAGDAKSVFSGGHDTAVSSLLAGDCDIAFVGDVYVDTVLPARGLLKPGQVTKVWTSPLIPAPPVVVGNWLPPDQRSKIAQAITRFNAEQMASEGNCPGAEIAGPSAWGPKRGVKACRLDAATSWQFVSVTDQDYAPITRICEATKAEVCTGTSPGARTGTGTGTGTGTSTSTGRS